MRARRPLMPMTLAAALLLGGCGSMTRTAVDTGNGGLCHYKTRSGRRIRVELGTITVTANLDEQLRPAVARYLQHQATAALGQHDIFTVADREARPQDLLGQFMQAPPPDARPAAATDAVLHVEVTELKERKGATVRVGLLSQQSKNATAQVRLRLVLRNGRNVEAVTGGRAEKGAWGVVAMTQRQAMDRKGGVWELDGSMAGTACSQALLAGTSVLAERIHRDIRRMNPDAMEQWLR